MNTFRFVGNMIKPKDKSKLISNRGNCKILKFGIKQNENNIGFVELVGFPISDNMYVRNKDGSKSYISSSQRMDKTILKNISFASKYITNIGSFDGKDLEFITPMDLLENIELNIDSISPNDTIVVTGTYDLNEYDGKYYNKFNIKTIRIDNSQAHDLTLKLDLVYNYKSLDLSDKMNRMILNGYISQYSKQDKKRMLYPIQTQFNTNGIDLDDEKNKEMLNYRKENLCPPEKLGYVKSTWECQYVRGAQMIMPPLNSLPKSIRFEIQNAGRDLKEYMSKVVGESKEIICLIRPDNTKTLNNEVYESLNLSDDKVLSLIKKDELIPNTKTDKQKDESKTIDKIAHDEAFENPFNF